jgi:inner membrane protein YidH
VAERNRSEDETRTIDAKTVDATRRTHLATERTQLAWWRTGLTALAVALAVGRVVPELQSGSTQWPYTVIGVGFALYAIALIFYGTSRATQVEEALSRGEYAALSGQTLQFLTAVGIALSVATAALIIFD